MNSQIPWVPVRDRLGGDLCKMSQGMANTRVLPNDMWRIVSGFCQLSYLDVMPLLEPCLRDGRVYRMPPNKQKWLRPFVLEYLSSKFEEGRDYSGEWFFCSFSRPSLSVSVCLSVVRDSLVFFLSCFHSSFFSLHSVRTCACSDHPSVVWERTSHRYKCITLYVSCEESACGRERGLSQIAASLKCVFVCVSVYRSVSVLCVCVSVFWSSCICLSFPVHNPQCDALHRK